MATCFLNLGGWDGSRNELRINDWIPLAHSYNEVTFCITSTRDVDGFYEKRYHLLNGRVANTNGDEVEPLLQEYLLVFNSIFFHNALVQHRVRLNFVHKDSAIWRQDGHKVHGWASDRRGDVRDENDCSKMSSNIMILESADEESDEDKFKGYLSTLLHEMIHALINIYVCGCRSCGVRYRSEQGFNGHGTAWQQMAHWIEVFCSERLRSNFDLGRAQAMAEEIWGSQGRIEMYDEQIRRLSLDVEEVRELMDGMSSTDDSGETSWAGHGEDVFEPGNDERDSSD